METKEFSTKSRVRGDFQARFCEKGRVKFPPTYSTQQEYNIYIKEGCEIKTAQMLDALGIAHRLPFTSVEIDGIQHLAPHSIFPFHLSSSG